MDVRTNSSNLDLLVLLCHLAGYVNQEESTSETLEIDTVEDQRAPHSRVNKEEISAETALMKESGTEENLSDQKTGSLPT